MKLVKTIFLTGVVVLVIAATGCDFSLPESVRIIGSPTLRIPLGTKTNLLSEAGEFDIDADIDSFTDPNSPDYIEGLSRAAVAEGEPVTLQMTVDVIDISIDEFAGDTLNLDSFETDNQNVSTSVTVPEIAIPNIGITAPAVPVSSPFINMTIENDITIAMNTGAEFIAATIESGNITVTLDIPSSWGINDQYYMTLTLYDTANPGMPLVSETDNSVGPPDFPRDVVLDLANVPVGTTDFLLSYSLHLESTTNTADLSSPTNVGGMSGSVDSFSMLQINYPDFDTIDSFSSPVDPEVADLLTSVTFTDPKLTFTVNNRLPIPISITVDSDAMRTLESHTFEAKALGDTSNEVHDYNLLTTFEVNVLPLPEPMDPIDFDINVSVTAPNTFDGTVLTINSSVDAGATYSMTTSVDVDLEVASIEVTAVETEEYSYPEGAEGVNFAQLGDVLPEGVTFSDITGELLLDLDESVDNKIGLRLWTDYDADANPDYLMGGSDSFSPLTGSSVPMPGLPEVINARPEDLYFYYVALAENVPIMNNTEVEQRIAASLRIILPLQINVAEDPDSPFGAELLGDNDEPLFPVDDEDIFGRDNPEDREDIQENLEMLESITLNMDIENNFGISLLMRMDDRDRPLDSYVGTGIQKEFTLDSGPQTIGFSREEMDLIIASPSFRPAFNVYIPPGTHQLSQGSEENPADISISLWMELETHIDYTTGGEE